MELPPGFPWPTGTLVRGIDIELGMPVRASCREHIFEIASGAIQVSYGCGWAQSATCLHCCYTTAPIDATFWGQRATPFDLAGAFGAIAEEIDHLTQLRRRLEAGWTSTGPEQPVAYVVRDFG